MQELDLRIFNKYLFTSRWGVLRSSTLTDRLWKLTVAAMRSHAILILKTEIYQAYMSIHRHKMTTSSLFDGTCIY